MFVKVLANLTAYGQIYNISGKRYVTFDGLAFACAEAMGGTRTGAGALRSQVYGLWQEEGFPIQTPALLASIDKAVSELDWEPEFGLVDGLRDSYQKVLTNHRLKMVSRQC